MQTLNVSLGQRSYPIHIGRGLIGDAGLLKTVISARQVLVVTNEIVAPLYLQTVEQGLTADELRTLILPDGEDHKTLATFARIIDELIAQGFHRDACLVALGGGVIGDLGGFAAACYQRGIDFVQIPTTLLAQVDSSVGGKTGVNHPNAKNMIGAFHQPICVLADTDTLASLPPRELSAGLAEVIKYGLILDEGFFRWLEQHMEELLRLDGPALGLAIRRSCELKAQIVAEDERDHGRRALLNLGHTFGHALEALGDYGQWLHGEAVAVGICLACATSEALGCIGADDAGRVESLLRRARLPLGAENVDVDRLLELMSLDKKAGAGGLKLVLLEGIGKGVVVPAPEPSVLREVIGTKLAA